MCSVIGTCNIIWMYQVATYTVELRLHLKVPSVVTFHHLNNTGTSFALFSVELRLHLRFPSFDIFYHPRPIQVRRLLKLL
ncbi:hypothetical protein BT96DRAFT_104579 [Gymnopus androsaceus JB14]|uniref:Uncharacterized protein n=1 Tax=Gymnopus androsaceus JB14 TaxID=1447944 RepID=A0A6A4IAA0_9AGAR|nr:hypothetical protein BT96DRAFT_104579 [Gymnopus androsaceus JB14]